ncbi:MAG: metal ABC transporter substrate-binding protein [Gammaproteobacteria bacterium]|nr:metal ABC transporter substrate-binding protein [Gammaproteobacteria bacterium]NNK33290.1 zinc ABC transporter substrate-binding protein [Xanthomonadales bacterium]
MSLRFTIGTLAFLALAACHSATDDAPEAGGAAASESVVFAANYPLFFFAAQIAGHTVTIRMPDFDGDPAFWKPDDDEIRSLQQADLLLLNGAGYDSWQGWVTLPQDSPLDTSQEFRDRLVPVDDRAQHQHGPGGEHSHGDVAFTTWLDPTLAALQAEAVMRGLARLLPEHEPAYRKRLGELTGRLQELDRRLGEALAVFEDQPLLFSHPVYQYLAEHYGLDGVSLHWEPDLEPGAGDWIALQRILQRHPARYMLWEDAPLDSTADRLRELGIIPVVFQTLALPPEAGDYFGGMEANIGRLPKP